MIISKVSPSEWLGLNQFLHEVKQIDSACVSVYYPYGKGKDTISLMQERTRDDTTEKIKSRIQDKIINLRENPTSVGRFTRTLCIFGFMRDKRILIKSMGTSKRLPYIYMVGKRPYTKPFADMLKTSYGTLLITLDQKSAKIQRFHGSQIISEAKLRIDLQGRHRKGGQSQGRFLRARQTKIHVFFKKIAQKAGVMDNNSDIVLLGGTGHAKTEFYDMLNSEMSAKCRFVENLSFSTNADEVHKKIIHHLYEYRRRYVRELIAKYEEMVKDGLTAKRNSTIHEALERGAVDTLIVSANYYARPQFSKITRMLETAAHTSCNIEFAVSPKIIQKLDIDGSMLAILRYKIT